MKKLNITRKHFNESEYYQRKYGRLEYMSESGKTFKTEKGQILKFVNEAREYINDESIEPDTAEEFIIFDDPTILDQIANIQKNQKKKVEKEIKSDDVTKQDIVDAARDGAKDGAPGIGAQIASTAITSTANIITNPTVVGLAATTYGVNKAAEPIKKVWSDYKNLQNIQDINLRNKARLDQRKAEFLQNGVNFDLIMKGQDTLNGLSDKQMEDLGFNAIPDEDYMHNMEYHKLIAKQLPKEEQSDYLKSAQNLCDKYGSSAVAGATGAAGTAAATGTGTTIFGMSLATLGWIAAGVAAAAIITPYIYDKVRACTKTWMADIIAEVKFKADGKNYRCFYDLDENKWVLTYADVKWTSYMDNKLDDETITEFFASKFFQQFLGNCKKAFAMLFSTGRNEVVFKTLPEIKDAPKELKKILEKIYDNKGAIIKNLFTGAHD